MAILAAERAFIKWKEAPAYFRAEILENVVSLLKQQKEECARIIAKEAAKPIKTARAEVERTIMTYLFAAQEARRIHGETIPLDAAPGGENRVTYTIREPIGVIAAITPFNFPMNLVAHKVGPALAAGNTVVLKPASQTPLSAYKMAELFHEAGLPSGVLNVVTGSGQIVGDVVMKNDRIKMITFTGSPSVGKYIKENAGLKRVTLELGSNSALIIDEKTKIDAIIPRVVTGAFSFQGQVCISIQRIYVHQSLFQSFVEAFVQETEKLKIGDPLDEETDLSAMISKMDVKRAKSWVEEAVANGAKVAYGSQAGARMMKPTILLNVPREEKISCQEAFAPVVHVNSFEQFEDAIDEVNNSDFGLQAGVYTSNLPHAFQAIKQLNVGGVMINDIPTFRVDHMPYGGVKLSGMGREGIKYAIEEMTEVKLVSFKL
ncbi:Succinate-semialdehyde dehydrogenase [NADP(+)] GabD [Pseudoneobacillus rhizosphaerae]|uniref:Succinate-semialdehyde dehydrogenase [NADP(+)] GabD n=1 Tax=Pseudoneobacillus rhizosphaerae TaxID=2880968 RepID=A0A9C7LB56_9BACI|nr:Succinate-semialdehyde dehydrogenase [NADP(+)] GabD [Pseudoneobacillus rhizosphaerae]